MTYLFFFNVTATTEIYSLSLHDALPICSDAGAGCSGGLGSRPLELDRSGHARSSARDTGQLPATEMEPRAGSRSEEHTSELQSHLNLVCRLLLEKKARHNQ